MNFTQHLELAINIAVEAHKGQTDKAGKPYILHPLHLMQQCLHDPELAIIAVLHDVVEDSHITIDYLGEFFSDRVVTAITFLTKQDRSYEKYIKKLASSNNYDALRVKILDLQHNMDTKRIKDVGVKDVERHQKYKRAYEFLSKEVERQH